MPNKTWLIYLRKSVVKDKTDLESPERQLHICHIRLALLDDDYHTEVYQDLDRSGSNETGRPAWLDLKNQLHRPDVAGVIASSLDRIYRNLPEFLSFLTLLEDTGKQLILSKENVDTSPDNPMGRFFVSIMMAMYEMEWRLTSKRMRDMIADKRRRQGRHWGPVPFGTERDETGQLIPSTVADPAGCYLYDSLTEIFQRFSSGRYSYESLAAAMNANGWQYLDRFGQFKPFDKENIREILHRWRLYRGDLPLGNPRKNQAVEWLEGGHRPILPIELCDSVAYRLEARNRPYKARQTNRIYLLSGILHCAECGQLLTGQNENKRFYYRHSGRKSGCGQKQILAPAIEQQMLTALVEVVQHPTLLSDVTAALEELVSLIAAPDQAGREQINELRRRLDRLEDIYITGDIERSSYLTKRGQILAHLAELELRSNPQPSANLTTLLDDIAASMHLIINATPATQRELIGAMFRRLTAADGQIKTAAPQTWALPFFDLCEKWAGWDSNPNNTKPTLLQWLAPNIIQTII